MYIKLVFSLFIYFQTTEPDHNQPPVQMLPTQSLQSDFHILKTTLKEAHAGLLRYSTELEMDRRFKKVEADLSHPMTNIAFFRKLAPLIGSIQDAHTGIKPPKSYRGYMLEEGLVFPLELQFIEGKAYVRNNLSSSDIPISSQVISINKQAIEDILAKLLPGLSCDGHIETAKYAGLTDLFWLHYYERLETPETFEIEFLNGKTGQKSIVTCSAAPTQLMLQARRKARKPEALEFTVLNDQTALMTIQHFMDPKTPEFFKASFKRLNEEKIESLIIDLRGNSGGEDLYNAELFNYLLDHAYYFYKRRSWKVKSLTYPDALHYNPLDFFAYEDLDEEQKKEAAHALSLPQLLERDNAHYPVSGKLQPHKKGFKGAVYVLCDGGSVSSGGEIPAMAHHLGRATLIGEEPNAAYEGVTAGFMPELILPNSQIRVSIPLVKYENAVLPGVFEGRGVQPHFTVRPQPQDLKTGKDRVLDFTLALIKSRRPAR